MGGCKSRLNNSIKYIDSNKKQPVMTWFFVTRVPPQVKDGPVSSFTNIAANQGQAPLLTGLPLWIKRLACNACPQPKKSYLVCIISIEKRHIKNTRPWWLVNILPVLTKVDGIGRLVEINCEKTGGFGRIRMWCNAMFVKEPPIFPRKSNF
jgi:hypothetical protein